MHEKYALKYVYKQTLLEKHPISPKMKTGRKTTTKKIKNKGLVFRGFTVHECKHVFCLLLGFILGETERNKPFIIKLHSDSVLTCITICVLLRSNDIWI